MTNTTALPNQAVSIEQLERFNIYLNLFRQDVLPVQTGQYQYDPYQVHPRSLRSWYVFWPQAKQRYITPIATQRLYVHDTYATASDKRLALQRWDLPYLWMSGDGKLIVSWPTTDAAQSPAVVKWSDADIRQREPHLKYASDADLRSMSAHDMERIICQLGIVVNTHYEETDQVATLRQHLRQMDEQSYQIACIRR